MGEQTALGSADGQHQKKVRSVAGIWVATTALALAATLSSIVGCGGFFQCQKASCPASVSSGSGGSTGSTGSTGSDYAYVANSSAGTTDLSEYNISGGTLSSLATLQLGYIPVALVVSPDNSFLYVASVPGIQNAGIYRYLIGSTGTLTADNGGNVVTQDTVAAMAISPDGKWLYTVNATGATMTQYSVTPSTGALTQSAVLSLQGTPCTLTLAVPVSQSCSVTVAQSGNYVVASLGISGDVVYSYNSTNGITNNNGAAGNGVYAIPSGYPATPTGDFSTAVNGNNFAFVAQTNSVTTYGLQATGYQNPQTVTYAIGSAPRSITLNPAGSFVYTANESAGTISGFSVVSGGGLSAVAGSPTPGPANVSAIAVDKSGGYLVGVGYDANTGVRLYAVSATGVLTQVDQVGSGTNQTFPALVTVTH